jgi:hypothetical protein
MLSLVFDLTFRNPTGRAANGGSDENHFVKISNMHVM